MKFYSYLFFLLFAYQLPAQQLEVSAQHFLLDEMGFFYLINSRSIEKVDQQGQILFRTSDLPFGAIDYMDVTNPLKPFVYYKAQNKIVVYDNTLSRQGEAVDLFELFNGQIECVAGARGDAYWLWDAANAELIRTDQQFKKTLSSGNLSILLQEEIHPVQMLERGDYVYVVDESNGIFVFDLFGRYKTRYRVQPRGHIESWDNHLAFLKDEHIEVFWSDGVSYSSVPIGCAEATDFEYFNGKFYVLQRGRLETFLIRMEGKN